MKATALLFAGLTAVSIACQGPATKAKKAERADTTAISEKITGERDETMLHYPQERHLANIRQLTFGGDNAEGYFSFDNNNLVFQSNNEAWGVKCDQIFFMDLARGTRKDVAPPMLSTGKGRTTCSYFLPGDTTIIYASTHLGGDACPAEPKRSQGGAYVWPIYDTYDIFVADLEGNILDTLISGPGYDAEPTVSPNGDRMVFTSSRSGDLELYTCNIDGSDIVQITDQLGYDGGAFFSPDGSRIVFRSSRPKTAEEIASYTELLEQGLVEPTNMEIYVCDADGSNLTQVTNLGKANWAPFFHPGGEKIIFSSNHASERGFPFNLYLINVNGEGLEQVTFDRQFDAFAMFSYGGDKLVFASNRVNGGTRATNLFISDWVE